MTSQFGNNAHLTRRSFKEEKRRPWTCGAQQVIPSAWVMVVRLLREEPNEFINVMDSL